VGERPKSSLTRPLSLLSGETIHVLLSNVPRLDCVDVIASETVALGIDVLNEEYFTRQLVPGLVSFGGATRASRGKSSDGRALFVVSIHTTIVWNVVPQMAPNPTLDELSRQ
jgi:hypothetical protein